MKQTLLLAGALALCACVSPDPQIATKTVTADVIKTNGEIDPERNYRLMKRLAKMACKDDRVRITGDDWKPCYNEALKNAVTERDDARITALYEAEVSDAG